MERIEFQSSNIKCAGCVANVENGLKELDGVVDINVDIASNMVTVQGSNLDRTVIENKLTELGYPVQ